MWWCSCWRIKQIFRACPALMIENFIRFLIWDTAWTWNTTLQAKLAHGAKSATELKKYQKDQHFSSSVVRKLVNSESTAWCGSQDTASLILGYLAIADTTRGGRLPSTSPFCLPPSPPHIVARAAFIRRARTRWTTLRDRTFSMRNGCHFGMTVYRVYTTVSKYVNKLLD